MGFQKLFYDYKRQDFIKVKIFERSTEILKVENKIAYIILEKLLF